MVLTTPRPEVVKLPALLTWSCKCSNGIYVIPIDTEDGTKLNYAQCNQYVTIILCQIWLRTSPPESKP
jgi:putative component of toxin-antitoxin plasmid stabilization module